MIIKVGPIIYQLRDVEGLENGDGDALWGQAFHRAHEIRIATSHTPESRSLTLWHEVLHCFEPIYAIDLPEETIVVLATAIVQALQDNPMLNLGRPVSSNGISEPTPGYTGLIVKVTE